MKESDPEYVDSNRAYKKRVATRCRICGGQLLLPTDMKKEYHETCDKAYKSNTFMM